MAPGKNKGKEKETDARGSRNKRAGNSTKARLRTPTPDPESPLSTPPSSPHNPNEHTMTPEEEHAWRGRKPKSCSMGKFGEKKPQKPYRVDIHGGRYVITNSVIF